MPKYYIARLPAKTMAIADIKVIQSVPDSTRLGFLQKGLDNQKITAVPAKDFSLFLQEYVKKAV